MYVNKIQQKICPNYFSFRSLAHLTLLNERNFYFESSRHWIWNEKRTVKWASIVIVSSTKLILFLEFIHATTLSPVRHTDERHKIYLPAAVILRKAALTLLYPILSHTHTLAFMVSSSKVIHSQLFIGIVFVRWSDSTNVQKPSNEYTSFFPGRCALPNDTMINAIQFNNRFSTFHLFYSCIE